MKIKVARLNSAMAVAATMGMLVLSAGGASAAETGFYVAGDIGLSSFDLKKSEFDDVVTLAFDELGLTIVDATSKLDKSSIGFGLAAGYRFSPYVAAEASYLSLGKSKYKIAGTVTDGVDDFDGQMNINTKSSGPALSLIGSFPMNDMFSLDGRIGAYFSKTKLNVSLTDGVDSASDSDSDNDTGLLVGVGGTWSFGSAMALRFGYTIYKDAVGGERDVNQFFAGLQYSFMK